MYMILRVVITVAAIMLVAFYFSYVSEESNEFSQEPLVYKDSLQKQNYAGLPGFMYPTNHYITSALQDKVIFPVNCLKPDITHSFSLNDTIFRVEWYDYDTSSGLTYAKDYQSVTYHKNHGEIQNTPCNYNINVERVTIPVNPVKGDVWYIPTDTAFYLKTDSCILIFKLKECR